MAYESYTYENLLSRIMERITQRTPNVDTREGSMVYNAIAPEALELAMAYLELEAWRKETIVTTATRVGLNELCNQIGIDISIFNAKAGVFKGVFNVQVELDSRWNCENYNYTVESYIGTNTLGGYEYQLRCETTGEAPNIVLGSLAPIDVPPKGFSSAELTECLIEGEEEFTDDEIRNYYLNQVNGTAVDGNVEQYKTWCTEYNGIGNHIVQSLWNGDNTVLVAILSSSNGIATPELVANFQNFLDPPTDEINDDRSAANYPQGRGMGNGKAPIGAIVTVKSAEEKVINVSANVVLAEGYTEVVGLDDEVRNYFSSIAFNKKTINFMSIGAKLLDCPCVESISDLKLNGATNDISLETYEIPVIGTTTWSVV